MNGGSYFYVAVARLNPDGTLDTSFAGGNGWFLSGVNGTEASEIYIKPMATQSDGKIVIVGELWNGSDWDAAIKIAVEALTQKTKDLQIGFK